MDNRDCDIIIVGAGHVGLALALMLESDGHRVILLEQNPQPDENTPPAFDKPLLLNFKTTAALEAMPWGPYCLEEAYSIEACRVTQAGTFGSIYFHQEDSSLDELARVISMATFKQRLYERAKHLDVRYRSTCQALHEYEDHIGVEVQSPEGTKTLRASLVIAADGSRSSVRQLCHLSSQDAYDVSSHLIPISFSQDCQHTCFQRFTRGGLLAMIPASDQEGVLIFSSTRQDTDITLEDMLELSAEYAAQLGQIEALGHRVMKATSHCFRTSAPASRRILLLGNAAITIPPVTAQGFNLAFSDILEMQSSMPDNLAQAHGWQDKPTWKQYLANREARFYATYRRIHRLMNPIPAMRCLEKPLFGGLALTCALSRVQRHQLIDLFTGGSNCESEAY